MGGFAFDAGVGGRAEYALCEVAEDGGQAVFAFAGKQVAGFAAGDEFGFELAQGAACGFRRGQAAAVFTRRFLQQAFIVLLQPEEGLGVAADDIDQAAAGFQCEGGRGGGGLNQLQGVCELVGVLLQALLVERVAFEQVVFQAGGGPAAEGDTLR